MEKYARIVREMKLFLSQYNGDKIKRNALDVNKFSEKNKQHIKDIFDIFINEIGFLYGAMGWENELWRN